MLLVCYSIPIVQAMYLDEPLKEHTLLQAIARVNRLYERYNMIKYQTWKYHTLLISNTTLVFAKLYVIPDSTITTIYNMYLASYAANGLFNDRTAMLGADKVTLVCVNLLLTGSTNWTTTSLLGVSSPMTTSDCDRFIPSDLSAQAF